MKKDGSKMKERPDNAYLTVCIALCTAVLLSLCLILVDGVRRNCGRLETECVTEIGLQSILAEYHRELMRQYNLFAIDASYGTASCSKANTEAHLRMYLEKNLDYDDIFLSRYLYGDFLGLALKTAELSKVSILTDDSGAVFRRCASEAMQADVGLELFRQLQGWLQVVEVNGLEDGGQEEEKQRLDQEIEKYDGMEVEIEEDEWDILDIVNPTYALEEKKRMGLLRLVVEDEAELSPKALNEESLIRRRLESGRVNRGNIALKSLSGAEQLLERFLFQEYLLKYMGRYGKENEEDTLRYQVEYLIGGKKSDVENLRSMVNRLCLVREAANAIYLRSDQKKYNEIKTVASLVCTLIFLPELTSLLEGAIILGWAFAESIYDVRSLLAGGRIPLIKDEDSWHYGLTSALKGELEDADKGGSGLSYEDYLRIFMMLTGKENITLRAMNMVEADIRSTPGNSAFRLDGCYVEIEAHMQFDSTRYGYVYEIARRKKYH